MTARSMAVLLVAAAVATLALWSPNMRHEPSVDRAAFDSCWSFTNSDTGEFQPLPRTAVVVPVPADAGIDETCRQDDAKIRFAGSDRAPK